MRNRSTSQRLCKLVLITLCGSCHPLVLRISDKATKKMAKISPSDLVWLSALLTLLQGVRFVPNQHPTANNLSMVMMAEPAYITAPNGTVFTGVVTQGCFIFDGTGVSMRLYEAVRAVFGHGHRPPSGEAIFLTAVTRSLTCCASVLKV